MDKLQNIKEPIADEFEIFKQKFETSVQSSHPLLSEVLGYIRQRKGKMMRPMLILLTAKMLGTVNEATYHAAIALELLHTASLVHDDVVDESDKRRGQSSVNALYDNKVSVLVGDYLLAASLKHSAMTGLLSAVELVSSLGQDLSEGEIIQLTNTNATDFSETVYFDVIRKKTAALFASSAAIGALSVHADEENIEKARLFGELIGIAFQIKDDLFDYADSAAIGKPTGNDMKEGKLTLPALYALNHHADDSIKATALKIRSLEATEDEINQFIAFVKAHGGLEYAAEVMHSYRDKALKVLPADISVQIRESLTCFIDYVIDRDK